MQASKKQVALITGANRGIGFEIARQLAAKEITVLIGARDFDKGLKAQKELTLSGFDVHSILLDVTDPLSIQAAVDRIRLLVLMRISLNWVATL